MSQPQQNANTSCRQSQKQKPGGVHIWRVRKSKSQEPLGNWPSSLSQAGSMRSQSIHSAPGLQPIRTQLPELQAPEDEHKCKDTREDSMDSQDTQYDDDDSSEESMQEETEDDLHGDYGTQ